MQNSKESWNQGVEQYLAAEDIGFSQVIYPALVRHLGSIKGSVVLDYGCGNGRFSRMLEGMGAAQVIGVDIVPNMIAEAKNSDPASRVQYYETPDNRLANIADGSVDTAVANFVFMMASSKEDILQSMREIRRVLRPGGRLVYAITHPAFVDRDAYDYRNDFGETGFDYMKEGYRYKFILKKSDGVEINGDFYDYHYTLTSYFNMTLEAGFRIAGIEELGYPREVADKYNMPEQHRTYPHSLIIFGENPENILG